MAKIQGLTVHVVTPRVDPGLPGLSEFYAKIKAVAPKHKEARHLMPQDLHLMYAGWRMALFRLNAIGCVEWRVSHQSEDLPVLGPTQSAPQTRSAPHASTGCAAPARGKER